MLLPESGSQYSFCICLVWNCF